MLLLAIKASLKRELERTRFSNDCAINWHLIENKVAQDFYVKREHVRELRKVLFCDREIHLTPQETQGRKQNRVYPQTKVTAAVLTTMINFINERHADKEVVTANKLIGEVFDKHNVILHRLTIGRKLAMMGKTWSPVKPKKRSFSENHHEALRNFLIRYNEIIDHINSGNEKKYVLVFQDESYVNEKHQKKYSYQSEEEVKNGLDWSRGKGKRLVILHAITHDGPLCDRDEDGYPIDDLSWTGDTPHPKKRSDGKLTCETLWLATSSAGNYHDNMNSEIFMQWVSDQLVPTFKKHYPDHKMVLITDNAPYHHKREVGSLGNKTKKQVVEMMTKYNVQHMDLPTSTLQRANLDDEEDGVDHRGDTV